MTPTGRSAEPPTASIVGSGPAGLMAAEVLAEAGFAVTIHDRHRTMGRKLLLAGRSGLNLTHSEPIDDFVARYRSVPPVLEATVRRFDAAWLRAWAAGLGEDTFVGSSGRVFPRSFRAAPLLRAWLRRLGAAGVVFDGGRHWVGWDAQGRLRFEGGEPVDGHAPPDVTVLALGGASWPRVGSDGGWVSVLEASSLAVKPLRASNCGVVVDWSPVFRERFEGTPVKNVVVTVGPASVRGEIVITRDGIEGGPVYAVTTEIRTALDTGRAELRLDLAPDLSHDRLVARLGSKRSKETQSTWLRRAGFVPVAAGLLREATANRLPGDPADLATLAKDLPVPVQTTMPLARAISSAGGVAFDELDDHFMIRSRPGTFVAGEMLDWDAPTGGYLLQACFATGAAAGEGARDWWTASRPIPGSP